MRSIRSALPFQTMKDQAQARRLEIARTIQEQLGREALMLLGAHSQTALDSGLQFRIKGSKCQMIQIILTHADDYSVRFLTFRKLAISKDETQEGVYCDQLLDIIERKTGLYCSFKPRT